MAQPSAPNSRQSGPEAKKANMDALHTLKPGGPILPATQPFGKPNPTDRGKEHNTDFHKGEPNPEQHGTPGHIGGADHNPGMGESGNAHHLNIAAPTATGRTGEHSTKLAPPMPNPKGVRK